MEIKGLSMLDQMRTMRGVESITPKSTEGGAGLEEGGKGKKVSFGEFLMHHMEQTNQLGLEAEQAIQRSILGEETNPHQTMIAVEKADISLSLMMSVKERIERAYQELIRTPI